MDLLQGATEVPFQQVPSPAGLAFLGCVIFQSFAFIRTAVPGRWLLLTQARVPLALVSLMWQAQGAIRICLIGCLGESLGMPSRLLTGEGAGCECHKRPAHWRYCTDGLCWNFERAVDMGTGNWVSIRRGY